MQIQNLLALAGIRIRSGSDEDFMLLPSKYLAVVLALLTGAGVSAGDGPRTSDLMDELTVEEG